MPPPALSVLRSLVPVGYATASGVCRSTGRTLSAMRRYYVTTFGCQMNAHDSERIRGLLEELGLGEAPAPDEADVLVFNTARSARSPISGSPRISATPGHKRAAAPTPSSLSAAATPRLSETGSSSATRSSTSPSGQERSTTSATGWARAAWRRPVGVRYGGRAPFSAASDAAGTPVQAWVQVSMGCNSVCSYCIVPAVRGREVSRRPGDVLAEVTALAARGRPRGHAARPERQLMGSDLAAGYPHRVRRAASRVDDVDGIERIRFTSPHPKDFRAAGHRRDGRVRRRLRA